MDTKIKLAIRFAARLKDEVTAGQMAEVVKRNREEGWSSPVCHSHDFVDANMTMWAAFEDVLGREPALLTEEDMDLIGSAWAIAKAADFFPLDAGADPEFGRG